MNRGLFLPALCGLLLSCETSLEVPSDSMVARAEPATAAVFAGPVSGAARGASEGVQKGARFDDARDDWASDSGKDDWELEPSLVAWPAGTDLDQDGIPDDVELQLATDYLPFRSVSPGENCPESGILFRLTPHPANPSYLHIIYDVLYDNDCGEGGHPGDNEAFAITVDPSKPAPQGILAMVGIAHQGTFCNSKTECQTCGNDGDKCTTTQYNGATWPVAFASRNKHGNYMFDGKYGKYRCDYNCFFADKCELATQPAKAPLLNAGEPDHPLTRDLTDSGLVTPEHGFQEVELYHYDPWGSQDFGGAGVVSGDLTDSAFDTKIPVCTN